MKLTKNLFYGVTMILFLGLNSCATTKGGTQENVDVSYTVVKSGMLYGGGSEEIDEGLVIVQSKAEWDAIIKKMNAANQTITEEIDLEKNTVIIYFDKLRGSGGYAVKASKVISDGSKTTLFLNLTSPEGNAIDIMTQPYEIISIAKTDQEIGFKIIE